MYVHQNMPMGSLNGKWSKRLKKAGKIAVVAVKAYYTGGASLAQDAQKEMARKAKKKAQKAEAAQINKQASEAAKYETEMKKYEADQQESASKSVMDTPLEIADGAQGRAPRSVAPMANYAPLVLIGLGGLLLFWMTKK